MKRIFQTIVTADKAGDMKMSFASVEKALDDIDGSVAFSRTPRGQEVWGNITGAVICNKETGETTTVI